MTIIARSPAEAKNRCPDSGTLVYPGFIVSESKGTAWCSCCGRNVKFVVADEVTGKNCKRYAEHSFGSIGHTRSRND